MSIGCPSPQPKREEVSHLTLEELRKQLAVLDDNARAIARSGASIAVLDEAVLERDKAAYLLRTAEQALARKEWR